jgi:hypothetical protein
MLQTELAGALRVTTLLSALLRATALLLFITTGAMAKRPMSAKRAALQVISRYMGVLRVLTASLFDTGIMIRS